MKISPVETDTKKLIVVFRNFAKAPKTYATYSGPGSSSNRRAPGFPLPSRR